MKIETHHCMVGLKIITSPIEKKSYVRLALDKIGSTDVGCP